MTKQVPLTMPTWLYTEIERRKSAKRLNRTEIINELIVRGLLAEKSDVPVQIPKNALNWIWISQSQISRENLYGSLAGELGV